MKEQTPASELPLHLNIKVWSLQGNKDLIGRWTAPNWGFRCTIDMLLKALSLHNIDLKDLKFV